jgi:hypothetical protein
VRQSLALLEPPLMGVPAAPDFFARIGPALEAFEAGDLQQAMARFLAVVTSLDWERCRSVVEAHLPGGVAQAMAGAETFFRSYLPALEEWRFGPEQAAEISRPILSVTGTETDELFAEGCALLRSRATPLFSAPFGRHPLVPPGPGRRNAPPALASGPRGRRNFLSWRLR